MTQPIEPQAAHVKLTEPHDRDHRRHPDIGLCYQHRDDRQQQCEGNQVAGKAAAQFLFGKQRGGNHRKARFDKFGGLQRQQRKIDPAARSLDLGADNERQGQQYEPGGEDNDGDAADRARRLQRHQPHDADRKRQQGEIAADKMPAVIADAFGDRRARRQAHDDPESHQNEECREAPSIDGPPPARHRALIDAGEPHMRRSSPRGQAVPMASRFASSEYILLE